MMNYLESTLSTKNNSSECCPISKSGQVSRYHP